MTKKKTTGSVRKTPKKEQKQTKSGKENKSIINDFLKHPNSTIKSLPFSKLVKIFWSRKVPTSKKELVFPQLLSIGHGDELARLYVRVKDQSKKSLINYQICLITGFEDGQKVFMMGKKFEDQTFINTGINSMLNAAKDALRDCEDRAGNLAKFKLFADKGGWLEGQLKTCRKQFVYIRDNAGYDKSTFEQCIEAIEKIDKLIAEFCIL